MAANRYNVGVQANGGEEPVEPRIAQETQS